MLSLLLGPLRHTVKTLLANDSPRQIAAGVALGVMLGLVPKGNLIAVSLAVLLFGLRVNKSAGLAAAAAVSSVGLWADPFFHRLGAKLLAMPGMQDAYAWLYDLPLGPWLGFNNTVVMGSVVTGLYLCYPVYLTVKLLLDRFQTPVVQWLMRYRVARALLGLDLSSRLGMASVGGGS